VRRRKKGKKKIRRKRANNLREVVLVVHGSAARPGGTGASDRTYLLDWCGSASSAGLQTSLVAGIALDRARRFVLFRYGWVNQLETQGAFPKPVAPTWAGELWAPVHGADFYRSAIITEVATASGLPPNACNGSTGRPTTDLLSVIIIGFAGLPACLPVIFLARPKGPISSIARSQR